MLMSLEKRTRGSRLPMQPLPILTENRPQPPGRQRSIFRRDLDPTEKEGKPRLPVTCFPDLLKVGVIV